MVDAVEQARAERRAKLEARLQSRYRRDRLALVGLLVSLALLIAGKVAFDLNRPPTDRRHEQPASLDAALDADLDGTLRIALRPSQQRERQRDIALKRPDFVMEGPTLVWTDGAEIRYEIAEVLRSDDLVLHTPADLLIVPARVWGAASNGPPAALEPMIHHAVLEDLSLDRARLTDEGLGPLRIVGEHFLIVPGGVLRVDPSVSTRTAPGKGSLRSRLRPAIERFTQGLESAPIDDATRAATREILDGLQRKRGSYFSTLKPKVICRLIRHGWLKHMSMPPAETAALENAIAEATRLQPIRRLAGAGGTSIRYRNLFGRTVEVLTTAEGTWYTCPQPDPQWLGSAASRSAVVQLPAGADPIRDAVVPVAASLRIGRLPVGTWNAGGALELDHVAWQRRVSSKIRGQKNTPFNIFPGHILITDVHGDALVLVTEYGTVRPARDGTAPAMQRFFDECAIALPDAAHMDLVGEILYDYAWDTAEYDRPLLIGTETHNGDIHQTAAQTLATCCGGMYRGDCDDLACFFHALTTHQGRNAHVLSLPHHLANAYAERSPDGAWTVSVLHTGPPIEVRAATLDAALRKTYEHFESHESIDLGALPISLRFGGDAVRERYLLPAEIFANRDYGQGLVAVQAAYRFHTYLSGIETMKTITAARTEPTAADFRELAHLLRWADRYADAVEPFERALAAARDPATRVDAALDLLTTVVKTGPKRRLKALALQLEDELIPAFERVHGSPLLNPWLRLANALLATDAHRERGLGYLSLQASRRVRPSLKAIEELAARKNFDPRWLHYRGMPRHTTNVSRYMNAALAGLRATREDSSTLTRGYRAAIDRVLRRWFLQIAFRTIHDNARVLSTYGSLASFYEGHLGEEALAALVEKAGPADADDLREAARPTAIDLGSYPRGLRLIHIASGYRRSLWWRCFTADAADFDAGATKRAMLAELVALDTAQGLGQGHHSDPTSQLFVRLALAVLDGRPKAMKPILAEIAARKDHGLRDRVATLVGAAARRHPVSRWRAMLEVWADALDHAPNHFEVAWAAKRAGFPAHAVAAGRHAVERHPNRREFARELQHLMEEAGRK